MAVECVILRESVEKSNRTLFIIDSREGIRNTGLHPGQTHGIIGGVPYALTRGVRYALTRSPASLLRPLKKIADTPLFSKVVWPMVSNLPELAFHPFLASAG